MTRTSRPIPYVALAAVLIGAVACGDDDSAPADAGMDAARTTGSNGGKGGHGGQAANSGGRGTSPSARQDGSPSGGRGTSPSAGQGGSRTSGAGGSGSNPTAMCTQELPTDNVTCGGQTCQLPSEFSNNECLIPCCVQQHGEEVCGSKSLLANFPSDCALPAQADPTCPDIDSQAGPLKGCCNMQEHKCGIISTLRPGCITQSSFVDIPQDRACGENDMDGGVEPEEDAGR